MAILITFPDGNTKKYPDGTTAGEVATDISVGLAKNCVAAEVNGKLVDLDRPITENAALKLLTPKELKGIEVIRHSCAHILAQAVKRLYPDALPTIGPTIEHGFYYDFDNLEIVDGDLVALEEEMKKIVKEEFPTKRHDYHDAHEAMHDFGKNPYKAELIEEHAAAGLSKYTQGEFSDLCRGPHCPHTGWPAVFKLDKVTKAYWRGDSTKKQLTRIYGFCFAKKSELDAHLTMLAEDEKRDNRKLGKELGLLMFHEYSPGAPFFLPKGAIVYNALLQYIREEYAKRGYTEVVTPLLYEKGLWETSGHWEHYRDDMFLLKVEGREFSLKPMNCPSHCLIYGNEARSYRDLPLRIADFAPLHRNELSGTLSGLTRVRKFSQDDAHIFCMPEQIEDEIKGVLEFVRDVYGETFKMEHSVALSTRPEKFMGEIGLWEQAEASLTRVLEELQIPFTINPGDGAFYGPKIDIRVKDALGREFQTATVQLDFQLPRRFELTYEGDDGHKHTPVMIHRAVLGSLERFFGVAIEHYAGKFPLWLSPEQVRILPIADRHAAYGALVVEKLKAAGLRASLDDRQLTTNKKVREAQLDQVNYILVVGDKEVEAQTINVRTRDNVVVGEKALDAFIVDVSAEAKERR